MTASTTAPVTEDRPSRRRALLPLATLLAAAAIAMASGADFTSQTVNPANAYETGTLEQTNSLKGRAIFDMGTLKPGDSVTGKVTITNSGSLPARFTLTESAFDTDFADPDLLTLTVTQDGATVYQGEFGKLTPTVLGNFEPGDSREYTFVAKLDHAADNDNQGKSATATYTWDGVQTDTGENHDMGYLTQD